MFNSDDLLFFAGYSGDKITLIYGINYERHGVTFHFPPEVKIESRISSRISYKDLLIYLEYENEFYKHYGFIDNNSNIWNESYENGSIQRTNTILISLEYIFKL